MCSDVILLLFCLFFFFKQKTAYEMRISDWSSDVCSSDLFNGTGVKLEKTKNREDETRFKLTINLEVAEVKAVTERGVNKEELVGKKHNESFYIVPAKAEEGIGLIRAFYADIGLPNGGVIGAAEDDDGNPIEGFADGIVGHTFPAKIVRVATKDDPSTKFSRLRLK